ncbi:MAG: hypothetical protein U9O98_00970 [Asgard group archaeon]|nr:hypothetical protein [Asgard group archaeon]
MSKKLVKEAKNFRDQISELEGLLIGKKDGSKIWSDTLRDLNHEFILSSASVVIRAMTKLCEAIDKDKIQMIDCEIKEGYLIILLVKDAIIVGFMGEDARSQLAIIKQNLRRFAKKVAKFV